MSEQTTEAAAVTTGRSGGKAALVLAAIGCTLGYAAFRMAGESTKAIPLPDVQVISHGDPIELAPHATRGKYTIFDFYADWCPLCHPLGDQLKLLAAEHRDVAIRKIDIVNWGSLVAEQHAVKGLPYMVLFGPDGQRLAEGNDVHTAVSRIFQVDLQ